MRVGEGGDPTNVIGRRIVGAFFEALIDALFLYTLFSFVGVKVGRGLGTVAPASLVSGSKVAFVYGTFLVWVIVTKVVTLGMLGWTPGMLMMNLRCVRYDGRPPGLVRALVRTIFYTLYAQFGCLFYSTVWIPMTMSKSHKGLQDMLVDTYVIDGIYRGHLLIPDFDGAVMVGPESVTRKEAETYVRTRGGPEASGGFQLPVHASAKSGEPFLDKNLGTYVVWNSRQGAWLAFDKTTEAWIRVG